MSPVPSLRGRTCPLVVGWALAALLIHVVGNAIDLYDHYYWFQVLTHFCSSTALAALLARAGWALGLRDARLYAFVVVFATTGAIAWEVVEYLGIFENLHFHGLDDSLLDMSTNAVGVAVVLLAVRTLTADASPNGATTTAANDPE